VIFCGQFYLEATQVGLLGCVHETCNVWSRMDWSSFGFVFCPSGTVVEYYTLLSATRSGLGYLK
jgi:hypothetical protein